jgi:aspartate carbamoyltransferase regulatory subunit
MERYELKIDKIQRGLVIDHIEAGKGMSVYRHLKLDELDCRVAIILNVFGRSGTKKDIIKIEDRIDIDMDVLGYFGRNITVNIVEDGYITEKRRLDLPHTLKNVIQCKNPRCITSIEQGIVHIFMLADEGTGLYRCGYCEQEL